MSSPLILDVDAKSALVFGLRWQSVVGANPAKTAKKRALAERATHLVFSIDENRVGESVGLAKLEKKNLRSRKGVTLYSAAQAFARLNPQGVVCLKARLPDDQVWFVAARSGTVIARTDVVGNEQYADELLSDLSERYEGSLKVLDADEAGVDIHLLSTQLIAQTKLTGVAFSISTIPKPILFGVGVIVAFVAVQELYGVYKKFDDERRLRALISAGVDPVLAWQQALDQFSQSTLVSTHASFVAVMNGILNVPRNIGRWSLLRTDCQAQGGEWLCAAEFKRTRLGTNASFDAAKPKGWQVSWTPLDGAIAMFKIAAPFGPLALAQLPDLITFQADTVSRLQVIRPAFTSVVTTPPVPAKVNPPTNKDGQVIAQPAGSLQVKQIDISFGGPLRSAALIDAAISKHIAWQSVSLQFVDLAEANLTQSQLVVQIKGSIYAK